MIVAERGRDLCPQQIQRVLAYPADDSLNLSVTRLRGLRGEDDPQPEEVRVALERADRGRHHPGQDLPLDAATDGAVLVRPDRFIAWCHQAGSDEPRAVLAAALSRILARPVGAPAASAARYGHSQPPAGARSSFAPSYRISTVFTEPGGRECKRAGLHAVPCATGSTLPIRPSWPAFPPRAPRCWTASCPR